MELRKSINPPRRLDSSTGSWEVATYNQDDELEFASNSDFHSAFPLDHDTATEPPQVANPPRRRPGRPRTKPLKEAAASLSRCISTAKSTSSTLQRLEFADTTLRDGPTMANSQNITASNRANGHSALLRSATQNQSSKAGRNMKPPALSAPPPEAAAFPTIELDQRCREPDATTSLHGIARLMWQRGSAFTQKWSSSYKKTHAKRKVVYADIEASDVEEDKKIPFRSLYSTLRHEIITQIADESGGMYSTRHFAVQCLLNISLEEIERSRVESLEVGDGDLPPHIAKWMLEHPGKPIDPETPPPGALKVAYDFLRQEDLPFSLLGLWNDVVDHESEEMTPLCQGDDKDDSASQVCDVEISASGSDPNALQHKGIRKDSAVGLENNTEDSAKESQSEQIQSPKNSYSKQKNDRAPPSVGQKKPKSFRTKLARPYSPLSLGSPTSAPDGPSQLFSTTSALTDAPLCPLLQNPSQSTDYLPDGDPTAYDEQLSMRAARIPPPPSFVSDILPSMPAPYQQNETYEAPNAGMNSSKNPTSESTKACQPNSLESNITSNLSAIVLDQSNSVSPGSLGASTEERQRVKNMIGSRTTVKPDVRRSLDPRYSGSPQVTEQYQTMMSNTPVPLGQTSLTPMFLSHDRDLGLFHAMSQQQQKVQNMLSPHHGHVQVAHLGLNLPHQATSISAHTSPSREQHQAVRFGNDLSLGAVVKAQQQQWMRRNAQAIAQYNRELNITQASSSYSHQSIPHSAFDPTYSPPGAPQQWSAISPYASPVGRLSGSPFGSPLKNNPGVIRAMLQQQDKLHKVSSPQPTQHPEYYSAPLVAVAPQKLSNIQASSDSTLLDFPLGDDLQLTHYMARRQQASVLTGEQSQISPLSFKSGSAQMALAEQRFVDATPTAQRFNAPAWPGFRSTSAKSVRHGVQLPSQDNLQPSRVWTGTSIQELATPIHTQKTFNSSSSGPPSSEWSPNNGATPERANKSQKKESPTATFRRMLMEQRTAEAAIMAEQNKAIMSTMPIDPALTGQNTDIEGITDVGFGEGKLPVPIPSNLYQQGHPYHYSVPSSYSQARAASVSPSPAHCQFSNAYQQQTPSYSLLAPFALVGDVAISPSPAGQQFSNPYQQYPPPYSHVGKSPVSPSPICHQPFYFARMNPFAMPPPPAPKVGEKRKRIEEGGDL